MNTRGDNGEDTAHFYNLSTHKSIVAIPAALSNIVSNVELLLDEQAEGTTPSLTTRVVGHTAKNVGRNLSMPDITDAELSEISEYCKAATEGPWRARVFEDVQWAVCHGSSEWAIICVTSQGNDEANARLTAHSRTDLPRLVKAQQAKNAESAQWKKSFEDECDLRLEAIEENDTLKARIAELEKAVQKYGGHMPGCESEMYTMVDASDEREPCSCGFDAMLAAREEKSDG